MGNLVTKGDHKRVGDTISYGVKYTNNAIVLVLEVILVDNRAIYFISNYVSRTLWV